MRAGMTILTCVVMVLSAWAIVCGQEIGTIEQIKPMYLQTELVAQGEARCIIAAPKDEQYQSLARRVAQAIETSCGVAPPIRAAAEIDEATLQATNVIALGVFCVNAVTERLYLREYVLCDYSWPKGEDSYVIRTVHNPWLSGTNVVFVGGARPAGMQAAVERFAAIVAEHPDGVLGPIIEVRGEDLPATPDVSAEAGRIAAETSSRTMGGRAAGYADAYFRSGAPEWAQLFLLAMRKLDELQAAEGAADDVRSCRYIFHQFDRIEEGPAFSDADRAELTNLFYRFAHRLTYANTQVRPSTIPHGNDWNAIGAAFAGMYFSRYYPELEIGRRILANLDVYYEPNMTTWKVNEDCPGYGDITLTGNYNWALHRPDRRYIDPPEQRLRRMADYDMLITDNTGRVSGFGDASGLSGSYLVQALPLSAWLYRDGRYLWWWDHHGGQPAPYWVPPEVLPRTEPLDLLGVAVAPLDDWIYGRNQPRVVPREACFDKASFRAGFDPDDEYLCLSGFGYGFHSHPDANAIVRLQDEGEIFLYDDGYMIPSLSEHNSIIVLKGGWAGEVPELAQVTARADFADLGIFASRLDDYNGARWERTIIWPKSRYFLVIDELRAQEAAQFSFQCIYRTLGNASLDGRRWTAEKEAARFTLIAASDAALSQKQSAGTSLNAPPFPMDEARRLVQSVSRDMQPGDSYRFANLFYVRPRSDAQEVAVQRLGDSGVYVVDDAGALALAGVGHTADLPGVAIDATAFHLTPQVLTAAGAEMVRMGGPLLWAEPPVDLRLDLASGQAVVVAAEPATVTCVVPEGEVRLPLEAGRHELRLRAVDAQLRARIEGDLRSRFDRLAAAPEEARRPAPGSAQGMNVLWEYDDFAVYRNFAAAEGVELSASVRHMTPDEAGYPVGEPKDLLAAGGNVMFPDGERVLLDLDLQAPRELTQIVLNSRQLRTFNGGCGASRFTVWVSGDRDFTEDERVGQVEITEELQDALMAYAIDLVPPATGRYVRVEAVPYTPAHNVYLDSIVLNGIAPAEALAESDFHMNAVVVADVDGDGRHEIFTGGTDRAIHAIAPDGTGLWRYGVGDVINDLTAADSTGAGDYLLVAGCADKTLYAATEEGMKAWTVVPPPRTYARAGYRGVDPFQGSLTVVFAADLGQDGDDEIIVGSANWRAYVYDHAGELLWDEVLWAHTPTCGTAYDLDGDGKLEVIMGNTYTSSVIYSWDGKILGSGAGSGHAGPIDIAAADLDGNGMGEMITGDRAGMIWLQEWQGRDLPDYNAGSDITSVAIGDVDGDGRLEAAAASRNFLLYLFDADGQPVWQSNLLDVARDIAIADVTGDERLEIVCACEDGTVKVVSAEGEVVAWYQAGAWVRHVRACELDGDPATAEVVATCDDGRVYALQVAR
ncbi:MAG: FG-GAP-like repeat-containing protein [Armatimonadota bacterium]